MTAILKGPNCRTATEDCTQERPAPHLQDPPIPVMGLAVAEVHNARLFGGYDCFFCLFFLNLYPVDLMWGCEAKALHTVCPECTPTAWLELHIVFPHVS